MNTMKSIHDGVLTNLTAEINKLPPMTRVNGIWDKTMEQVVTAIIAWAAMRHHTPSGYPNQCTMARALGINRNTLRKYIQRYNINLNDYAANNMYKQRWLP